MDLFLVGLCFVAVITIYFRHNPLHHSRAFIMRRFVNWFPLGMTYAFLYMARYNLNVSKNALGNAMTKEDFGIIFAAGTITYGLSFLLNGPLVDRIGGKKGIIIAALGACLANMAMGLVTYLFLHDRLHTNLTVTFSVLYALNMFFQSYGAVSIIKVKAYWFHVRERGIFGAIFGTLISFGVYFAFDWGRAIVDASKVHPDGEPSALGKVFQYLFAVDTGVTDATWLVFFIPSFLLIIWALIDMWLIRDTPGEAGYEDFDTHDASSGEMDKDFTIKELLHRVFTSRAMLIVSAIEFTGGVIRNGIMQWYTVFAAEVPQVGAEIFSKHWGLLLCFFGIAGGFAGGFLSDKVFQSRRGPPVGLAKAVILVSAIMMAIFLFEAPAVVALCALVMTAAVICVHSLMSGTAAADFGGRKATATASGIVDGFVYLGSGLQSLCLGFLISESWYFWPLFMAPFAVVGLILAIRIWNDLPAATKRYLATVEKIVITTRTETVITATITSTNPNKN
ncbi:MAG: MFS transporter [Bdellovibrionales bacterium]|nr:MFS transporter [Bdellovibrionales bacterium]